MCVCFVYNFWGSLFYDGFFFVAHTQVIDMPTVLEVITVLEKTKITKEQLEATRLAKYINQLRRKTQNDQLARRSKNLLKKWREMVIPATATAISIATVVITSTSPPFPSTPTKAMSAAVKPKMPNGAPPPPRQKSTSTPGKMSASSNNGSNTTDGGGCSNTSPHTKAVAAPPTSFANLIQQATGARSFDETADDNWFATTFPADDSNSNSTVGGGIGSKRHKKHKRDKKKHRDRHIIDSPTASTVCHTIGFGSGDDKPPPPPAASLTKFLAFDPSDSLSSSSISRFATNNGSAIAVKSCAASAAPSTIKSSELTFSGKFSSMPAKWSYETPVVVAAPPPPPPPVTYNSGDIIHIDSSSSSSGDETTNTPIAAVTAASAAAVPKKFAPMPAQPRRNTNANTMPPAIHRTVNQRQHSQSPVQHNESQSCSPFLLAAAVDTSNESVSGGGGGGGCYNFGGVITETAGAATSMPTIGSLSEDNTMTTLVAGGDDDATIAAATAAADGPIGKKRGRKKGSTGVDRRLAGSSKTISGGGGNSAGVGVGGISSSVSNSAGWSNNFETVTLLGLKSKMDSMRGYSKKVKTTKELLAELQMKKGIGGGAGSQTSSPVLLLQGLLPTSPLSVSGKFCLDFCCCFVVENMQKFAAAAEIHRKSVEFRHEHDVCVA